MGKHPLRLWGTIVWQWVHLDGALWGDRMAGRGGRVGGREGREGNSNKTLEELDTAPVTDLEVSHRVTRAFASKKGKGLSQASEVVEVLLKLSGIYLDWRWGRGEEGRWERGGEGGWEGGGRKGGKK